MSDGRLVLPPLSKTTPPADLQIVFQAVAKKLGKSGKETLRTYVRESGLEESHEAWPAFEAVFLPESRTRRRL